MSSTIIAYTIIGSKVNRADFFIQTERSVHGGCDIGPGSYCSTCGKSIHEVVVDSKPVNGFDPEGGYDFQGVIDGMNIVPVLNSRDTEHFLAIDCKKVWDLNKEEPLLIQTIDLAGMRNWMRDVLTPLGLWVPENFGIWTALNYS